MVDFIESRSAGRKLIAILFALLLPVFVLGFIGYTQTREDVMLALREEQGVRIIALLAPVAAAVSEHGDAHAVLEARRASLLELAERVDIIPQTEQFIAAVAKSDDPVANVQALIAYFGAVGEKSGLYLDPEPESIFLISALLRNYPTLLFDGIRIEREIETEQHDAMLTPARIAQYAYETGRLSQTLDKVTSLTALANSFSSESSFYVSLMAANGAAQRHLAGTRFQLLRIADGSAGLRDEQLIQIEGRIHDVLRNAMTSWQLTTNKILALVTARSESYNRNAAFAGITSVVSILIGLGVALNMFLSTLKKLDIVDDARRAAEHARAEAERISSEAAELNSQLADKVIRLKRAQDELVKKGRMEQLGQLTATVAHEIRNPLGAIRTSVFLLERKINGKGIGVESQIDRINNSVSRCDNIITQLLDFSRVRDLAPELGKMDEWLAALITEEAAKLPSAVSVEVSLGLKDVMVPFDPARLTRAMINLISNASEAMVGNGSDAGKTAERSPRIWISTRHQGDEVAISVKDNGPGISAELMTKIREPLFTTKSFGTGLGIPAIEQIAILHGGRLEVRSEPGEGAEFTVCLPLQKTADARQHEKAA